MKILVLGGDGMLGHQLLKRLSGDHQVRVTLHQDASQYRDYGLFGHDNAYYGIDVRTFERLVEVLADFQPDVVINAVGVIKQRSSSKESIPSLELNALLPHKLSLLCKAVSARLVQISTDCVFSGEKGSYTEADVSDATDLYGKSKYLGELTDPHCVTLRTSIIGLELARKKSLIEWFLAQKGEIKGFHKAIYTGLTTIEMAHIIEFVLQQCPGLHGVWHVASRPISKYELLKMLADKLERKDITLQSDVDFVCDRSLIGDAFVKQTGYKIPEWADMINELVVAIKARGGM